MNPTSLNEIFHSAMNHNLNEIVRFHREVRNDLKLRYQEQPEDAYAVSVLKNYDDYLSANAFLMSYSHFEEYLYLIWKKFAPEHERKRNPSITRYEPVLEEIGIEKTSEIWQFMVKATYVRHCMLHANGRLSFMVKPPEQEMRNIIAQFPEELSVNHGDRLVVGVEFLNRFVDAVRNFQSSAELPHQ